MGIISSFFVVQQSVCYSAPNLDILFDNTKTQKLLSALYPAKAWLCLRGERAEKKTMDKRLCCEKGNT
ncbi:hypothetical protein SJDPG12_09315 [Porphyromonas gingivalis SJD12]|nr:hypothetical protein SJDPG12_09315 [Porphyromonas gingivalis SJD12]